MGANVSTGLTQFGVYGGLPAAVSVILIGLVRYFVNPGKVALMIITVLIAVGIPSLFTVLFPKVANSLKKDGSNDIDTTTAGTLIVVSLMMSIVASGVTQYALRKVKD